jgi:arylsulfatase A-like enzyme
VRSDLLDYFVEIEHFDTMVAQAMNALEKAGQLDNTIVVITSDHGMPFPRAKASLYDAGSRVPLAIRWPGGVVAPGRACDALVNLSDLAPTFLGAAGLPAPDKMTARSLMGILANTSKGERVEAFIAMERHDGCRKGGKGYPCRALRTKDYLYILNYKPDRWPAGNPDRTFCARYIPFGEVDSSPTKTLLMDNKDKPGFKRFYDLAFAMRPAEELYALSSDPEQVVNLAGKPGLAKVQQALSAQLQAYLVRTGDPRALGLDAPWDYYPYYGQRRNKNWQVDPKP